MHPEPDIATCIGELRALQARRASLEARARAIEEKRALTAPHIYEKVRHEAEEALRELEHKLATILPQAEAAARQAATGRPALEADLARLKEDLEEVRFRNSLGEYTPDQFASLEAARIAALSAAEGLLGGAQELSALVDEMRAPSPLSAPAVAAPAAATAPGPSAPAPAPAGPGRDTNPQILPPGAREKILPAEADEMEALFGSAPQPAASRPASTAPHAGPSALPSREETTQDLGLRAGGEARPGFPPTAIAFHPVLIVKTKDRDRGEDHYDLAPGPTLIGRAPDNDVILLEESVSRRHARIVVNNQEATIEDLGSANGSFLNGERLTARQVRKLQDNDVVKMGNLLALYRVNPED